MGSTNQEADIMLHTIVTVLSYLSIKDSAFLIAGALIGWNLIPQPMWVKYLYGIVAGKVAAMYAAVKEKMTKTPVAPAPEVK